MKKHMLVLFASALAVTLLVGCQKKTKSMVTEPSRPLATVVPTTPSRAHTTRPTVPDATSATTRPTVSHEATRETIEDGNGPIASQTPAAREKK